MTTRAFDLNIEEVLENWEVEHALREIIANALDEQVISKTNEIEIVKDQHGDWHIRDYGRGLKIEHFTLNENKEKLNAPAGVIGKFGVGLKDALATFHRRGVDVLIRSPFGTYRLKQEQKHGFNNIITLHVEYDDSLNNIQGTEFVLHGITDTDMAKAKSLFLKFAGEEILETNVYGQILRRKVDTARVYILGVFASEEPNFLFSYNITSLTDSIKKKLNRERLNVGRTTYADRVKTILKNAQEKSVEQLLVEQVEKRATGDQCDEMAWIEISLMALNLMHQQQKVVYFTEKEIKSIPDILDTEQETKSSPDILEKAYSDGYKAIIITEQQKTKLETQVLTGGPQVRTKDVYIQEYNESFQYKFVDPSELSDLERKIFDYTPKILALIGLTLSDLERKTFDYPPKILALIGLIKNQIPEIRISETMRMTTDNTEGIFDSSINAIVIKRSKLLTLVGYAGTLLHEVAHAVTGAKDVTREFENVLTDYLGKISETATK